MTCLKDPDSTSDVYVSSPFEENLSTATSIIEYLPHLASLRQVHIRQPCLSSFEPFICLYFVHLCQKGNDIGPSKEQCKHVSNACDEELKQIKGEFMVDECLSNCASESPFNKDCIITNYKHTVSLYNCNAGFYQDLTENGSCQPECNVWSPYPKSIVLITDILNVLAAVVCIISGGVVLVLSWICRQKL